LRLEDVVARIGGDEFSAILDDIDSIDDAVATAERIIASLGAIECSDGGKCVQTSVGIAIYPDHGTDIEELLHHADNAMYAAKRMGKGRSFLAGITSDDDDESTQK
jgi:diguanylate cyclase (GGDEF)-like protein